MLETITKYGVVFYVMGFTVAIGLIAKVISFFTIRKIVRAASEIQKSNHRLMRLVKAKFEHASMVSDKVQNVEAFVKKYLYEYRICGCGMDTWRELPKRMAWLTLVIGFAGTLAHYIVRGPVEETFQVGAITCGFALLLWSISVLSNESIKMDIAKNYMVDYLENVCLHRYEKMSQETPVVEEEPNAEKVVQEQEVEVGVLEAQERVEQVQEAADQARQEQEARIRAILQEFLV